jgi:phosphotriesterase-related protein
MMKQYGDPADFQKYLADVFMNEIVNGVGPSKVKCGIIKVASDRQITPYERDILAAAAVASNATGCPITTHSGDGYLGREQQSVLLDHGVPPQRIVIGHSCNTSDHAYHRHIVENGSYIGFDRFAWLMINSDRDRMEGLIRLLRSGAGEHVVIANDACFCWTHGFGPKALTARVNKEMQEVMVPTRITDIIIPQLKAAGVTQQEIDMMLIENPRRYFSRSEPPRLREKAQSPSHATIE